jgi:uncharacterized protein (TIGR01319 family)
MSAAGLARPDELLVLGDLGSTFTKAACVTRQGRVLSRATSPTVRDKLASGFARARDQVLRELLPPGFSAADVATVACSSAAGGLRLCVVGKEQTLTVQAGRQAASTAGARVASSYASAELPAESVAGFAAAAPDIVLLTGGASQGDQASIVASAVQLRRLAPGLPVIVAGNEDAYPQVRRALSGRPVVRFVANVMPRVGTLAAGPAQEAIRDVFVDHVMGRGRYLSASALAGVVRMPTPSAVLAGARALSGLGDRFPLLERPVVIDVGGATTDVHSVLGDATVRTVEGDLGLRENADALLEAGRGSGLVPPGDDSLDLAVLRRRERPGYLATEESEAVLDRRLAGLACTIAIERHAGKFSVLLRSGAEAIRKTGHDLRQATSLIATGGIFAHAAHPEQIIEAALRTARSRGALVPVSLPVGVDTSYALWAVGLLASQFPAAGLRLAETEFAAAAAPGRRG